MSVNVARKVAKMSKSVASAVSNNSRARVTSPNTTGVTSLESSERKIRVPHQRNIDSAYLDRKDEILHIARTYKQGQSIPKVQYSKEEIDVWNVVFNAMVHEYYPRFAIQEVCNVTEMMRECGFKENNIPQLQDVSQYLKQVSNFELRPVEGLLDARQFLNAMAFRVFYCTQYVRHHGNPEFSPDPDCIHDLLGHVPLLLNTNLANMSQAIGVASLNATDEQIRQLRLLYWHTIEAGVLKQNGSRKAYGAALLSSFGELNHLSDLPENKLKQFNSENIIKEGPIDDSKYQESYYYHDSLDAVCEVVTAFCRRM